MIGAILTADAISFAVTVAIVIAWRLFVRWRARRRFPGVGIDAPLPEAMPCLHCTRCHRCYRQGDGECVHGSKLCSPCSTELHHLQVPPESSP